jgi:hypothetical protein
MARKPSYPKDAAVGAPAAAGPAEADRAAPGTARGKRLMTGAAIGIGSAALVAALLYANRARKTDKGG